jgi:hypothetical protein
MRTTEQRLQHVVPVTEGTGVASPASRSGEASRKEEVPLGVSGSFNANDFFNWYDRPVDEGPPYAVKGAAHAHDRMEERTPFARSNVAPLQRAIDAMGLPPGRYHLPLRGRDGRVLGYAQFKSVPGRASPVLATVLGREMQPSGMDLGTFVKGAGLSPETNVTPVAEGKFDTDNLDPRLPESKAWNLAHTLAGSQETKHYAMRRAFNHMSEPTGEAQESAGSPPQP